MGHKRDDNVAHAILELAAMLPRWVGVGLAVIAYFGLHAVAGIQLQPPRPGQAPNFAPIFYKGAASALQYILPIILLVGAAASALTRRKRAALVSGIANAQSSAALGNMSWQEFEALVSEAFKLQGYTVTETGGGGADGGMDLVLKKGSEKFLVQCKQWQAYKVGVTVVRELYGVMAAEHATGGFVVTSGKFTVDAIEFARGRKLELLDGEKLFAMFDAVRAKMATPKAAAPAPQARSRTAIGPEQTPACPKCGKEMVKRTAKQGSNAGKPFWGCPAFPECRGIRPVA